MSRAVEVNGRRYRWPSRPVVVVCVDGCEPAYLDEACAAGAMPWLAALGAGPPWPLAEAVVPTFTNPNNLSIVTGVAPAVHGICGNYFLDPASGEEVLMNEPRFLRAPTLLAAFAAAGARVAVVTAKDKLRRLLGHGLEPRRDASVCLSAERADEARAASHGVGGVLEALGMGLPSVYSAALSELVLAAGCWLLETRRPDLSYLSTTDYVQHKHPPGSPEANAFYRMLDGYLARLAALGARVVVTADHGMSAKHDEHGAPRVLYLQERLDAALGARRAQVILPITDPYVAHHGALGGFATVYLREGASEGQARAALAGEAGIEALLGRDEACRRYALPPDRTGDLVVLAEAGTVLGRRPADHDLGGLDRPLRSHGGLSERRVPLICTHPPARLSTARGLRNYDAFDVALNE